MCHNLGKAPSFQRLRGPVTDMDGLPLVVRGAPVPSETMKSGSSISGNISATTKSAEMSGSFWRGPTSWKVLTPSIFLGGKNLWEIVNYMALLREGKHGKPRCCRCRSCTAFCVSWHLGELLGTTCIS